MPALTLGHNCPKCGERIELAVNIDVDRPNSVSKEEDWYRSLDPATKQLVDSATSSGLTQALMDAAAATRPALPKNPRKWLLVFFSSMKPLRIGAGAMLGICQHYGCTLPTANSRHSDVAVYEFQNIACLVISGEVRLFIPAHILRPLPTAATGAGSTGVKIADLSGQVAEFHGWIKTRMGYVPPEASEFCKQLRKRSVGAFSDVGL